MKIIVFCVVLLPLFAAVYAISKMLKAKRVSAERSLNYGRIDENVIKSRLFIVASCVTSSFIYGILELAIIYTRIGSFDAPEVLKLPCIISAVCFSITAVLKGIIGEKEIGKGMLLDDGMFGKSLVKTYIPELFSVVALVYFFLQIAYFG